jgi:hypothetical protein
VETFFVGQSFVIGFRHESYPVEEVEEGCVVDTRILGKEKITYKILFRNVAKKVNLNT